MLVRPLQPQRGFEVHRAHVASYCLIPKKTPSSPLDARSTWEQRVGTTSRTRRAIMKRGSRAIEVVRYRVGLPHLPHGTIQANLVTLMNGVNGVDKANEEKLVILVNLAKEANGAIGLLNGTNVVDLGVPPVHSEPGSVRS